MLNQCLDRRAWWVCDLGTSNLLCYPPTCRASWAQSSMVSQHWSQGEESWCTSVPAHSTSCGPWTFYFLLRLATPPGLKNNDTEVVLPFPAPTYLAMYLSMWSSECVRLMGLCLIPSFWIEVLQEVRHQHFFEGHHAYRATRSLVPSRSKAFQCSSCSFAGLVIWAH